MTWRKEDGNGDVTDLEGFAIGEKPIPLGSIRCQSWPVIDLLPKLLHVPHTVADASRGSGLILQITSRGKMVGMRVSVQYPLDGKPLFFDISQDRIGAFRGCRA